MANGFVPNQISAAKALAKSIINMLYVGNTHLEHILIPPPFEGLFENFNSL